jgi:hypothetical protein
LREGEACGLTTSPADDPRLDAPDCSDVEGVRGAIRSDGREPALPRTASGSPTAALGTRALGRSAAGLSAPGARALGTRALRRSVAGRPVLGALPTAGASRSVEGARAGERALGVLGLAARAGRSTVPTRSEGRPPALAVGLAARGADALGGRRSIAGRPWGRALARVVSPALADAVAGAATAVAVGLRVAVRTTDPRGSSLYEVPPSAKGDGLT